MARGDGNAKRRGAGAGVRLRAEAAPAYGSPPAMRSVLVALFALGFAAAPAVVGSETAALWSREVQPLFDVRCSKCHGLIERKAGLELDSVEAVLKGSHDGAVVQPGRPEASPLFQVLAPDADPHMPPKKQVTDAERESVRRWIVSLGQGTPTFAADAAPEPRAFGSVEDAVNTVIAEGWAKDHAGPAAEVEDRTWCRRVYLDLVGRIPRTAEVEAFLSVPAASRRAELVDQLLASPAYAVRMRELWDVFLLGRPKRESQEGRREKQGWWGYLERRFAADTPWNQVVRELLVARPEAADTKGSSWFLYERRNDHQAMAEATATLIYGTRIDCAQCHDHPLARDIHQAHYWGLVAAFNRSKNVEGGDELAESAIGGFINFTNLKKESQPALLTLLGGKTIAETRPAPEAKEEDPAEGYVDPAAKVRIPKFSRRAALAEAATTDNPRLAAAFVNRMWAVFFGRGLVQPVDEMNARNPASHPELLEWLAQDFAAHEYRVRRFVRGLVLSRPYALARAPEAADVTAAARFSAALERPLTAEQIARSWRVALGLEPEDESLRRAVVAALPEVLPREYQATFQQAQFLTHTPALGALLTPEKSPAIERILHETLPAAQVRAAFEAVLGRSPDAEEAARVESFVASSKGTPEATVREVLWALLTSAEFLTSP